MEPKRRITSEPPTTEPAAELTVGQLASRSGLSVSAIHFYERQGLVRSVRTASNHRRFPRSALRLLAVIKVGQGAGIPLARIREALAPAIRSRRLSTADWERISSGWQADLDNRIAAMTRLRDRLTGCIGCGCLSLEHCNVVNPGDEAAALGPGAIGLDGRAE